MNITTNLFPGDYFNAEFCLFVYFTCLLFAFPVQLFSFIVETGRDYVNKTYLRL